MSNDQPKNTTAPAKKANPTPSDIDALEPKRPDKVDASKIVVLASAKRDGKTVNVVTDGVATWKEFA